VTSDASSAYEWDAAKSDRCLAERGFDFAYAVGIFDGVVFEATDSRKDYGERRIVALGAIGATVFVVVYTWRPSPRGPLRRIISARLADRRERNAYRQALGEDG
jgi:uncharacterized DUF497 family protein